MKHETVWLQAYVEKCLREMLDDAPVAVDDDGDFFYRWDTAACFVRVEDHPTRLVKVFAHAATGVKRSARLLAELNELNVRARTVKCSWAGGVVLVSQELPAEGVTPTTLSDACQAVGTVAGDIGILAAAMFDGHTPFPPQSEPAEQEDAGPDR